MKKLSKAASLLVFASMGVLASNAVMAHHHGRHGHGGHGGHARFGFYIGAPLFAAPFYPYYAPAYPRYYPPVVVAPAPPPVYIENTAVPAAPVTAEAPENWWYYCMDARGYYPYVRDCPGGWQRVAPRPPNG